MHADFTPLAVGILILVSSLLSLRLGLSVAVIEILFGTVAGNFGLEPEAWMTYLAGFGGVLLTFLAGTEIDVRLLRQRFRPTFQLGMLSFLLPFGGVFLFAYYVAGWSYQASLIAGTALSTTSLAIVYSILVETGLAQSEIGKMIMAATFVTDMGTALAMSILFVKPTVFTLIFVSVSVNVIFLADKFSHLILNSRRFKGKIVEPEIKYVFALLLAFMYFANLGEGHAVLPAFVLGLVMSGRLAATPENREIRNRLRTVAYAIITPIFFIVGGLKVSLPLIASAIGLFALLFALKLVTKFVGVYFLARRFVPGGSMYTTLLMSTGLTFGTIASVFGYNSGLIDRVQYSLLVGVVVASAVIPTFVAQKWFMPVHSEDLVDLNAANGGTTSFGRQPAKGATGD